MVKKLLKKFVGLSILTFFVLAILARPLFGYLTSHPNIRETLLNNFGVTGALIILFGGLILLCYVISYLLFIMFKLGIKVNKKYNLVVDLSYKDFFASIAVIFGIVFIPLFILSNFNTDLIFQALISLIAIICGILFYKNKFIQIKEYGYKGFALFIRFLLTFIFGILSFPLLITKIPVWMVYGLGALAESSEGIDVEYGSFTDSNGKVTFYSNLKSKDQNGNVYHEDIQYTDSKGKDHYISKTKF